MFNDDPSTLVSRPELRGSAPPPSALGWRKVMYIRQPEYPDNYVDECLFLGELRQNVTVRLYTYGELVLAASLGPSQQLASVLLFVALFGLVYGERLPWLGPSQLLALANGLSASLYGTWLVYVARERDARRRAAGKQTGKSGVLLLMTLLGLTPVLWTLTSDISSDSIWTMSAGCLAVNMLAGTASAGDSAELNGNAGVVTTSVWYLHGQSNQSVLSTLSLNAAVAASVLLASRLPSKAHVFSLLTLSIAWFAFFPRLRARLAAPWGSVLLTLFLIVGAGLLLYLLLPWLLPVFLVTIAGITFILPAVYVYLQRYKNEIHGPWDEASLRLNRPLSR